jgi:hypothetical protein
MRTTLSVGLIPVGALKAISPDDATRSSFLNFCFMNKSRKEKPRKLVRLKYVGLRK